MLLSARILSNVFDVNNFSYESSYRFVTGNTEAIYFQLVDLAKDSRQQGFNPPGRRYIPLDSNATLSVTIKSVDSRKTVIKEAVAPFPEDASIWVIHLGGEDAVSGASDLQLKLVENGKAIYGNAARALTAYAKDGTF